MLWAILMDNVSHTRCFPNAKDRYCRNPIRHKSIKPDYPYGPGLAYRPAKRISYRLILLAAVWIVFRLAIPILIERMNS